MAPKSVAQRVKDELGWTTLSQSSRDVHLVLLMKFIRMFAYGSSTLIQALYFAALGHSDTKIGLFMTLTLIGDVTISLLLAFVADSLGRRKILMLGGILMAFSGVVFASFSNYWLLLFAAVMGVISPSGNEIGPFRSVEESTIAQLSHANTRSDIFAFYVVVGSLGSSGGSLLCGWLTQTLQSAGWTDVTSYRFMFWIYALAGLVKAGICMLLSSACETPPDKDEHEERGEESEAFLAHQNARSEAHQQKAKKSALSQISKESRRVLAKLCALFFFDSLASGMVPNSLISLWMERKFGMPQGKLGSIIGAAQFMSGVGNIFASSIAKRIGLVKAMVFTHLPSSIILALVPVPSTLLFTVALLVGRATLASMDQAPRSAFLSAIVRPEERTAVMGVVNTVKTLSQSSGPLITGSLAQGGHFWIAFVVAGSMKAAYDLGLLSMFVNVKLEGDSNRGTAEGDVAARTVGEGHDADDEGHMELSPISPIQAQGIGGESNGSKLGRS